MIFDGPDDRNRFWRLTAVFPGILLFLASCAPLEIGLHTSLDPVDATLGSVRSGTYRATLISILTPQFGGLVHSVLLDREDDDLTLAPRSATSAESAQVELGGWGAGAVAELLARLESHPAVRAAGTGYHEGFRSWTLFPIIVRDRLRGYLASVDSLAIFQMMVKDRSREPVIYYQDSSHFAEETGSGGGPGSAAGGAGSDM